MNLKEAISILKNAVGEGHLEGQLRIDLTLIPATEKGKYEEALVIVRREVIRGNISEDHLKKLLGLTS